MTCEQAQDVILGSERPGELDGAVSLHIAQCGGCAALARRAAALDAAAAGLPAPGLPEGKLAALRGIERHRVLRPAFRRPVLLSGIAAMLLVGITVGIYLSSPQPAAAAPLVDRLIDWNLKLAEAPAAQQPAIFSAQASELRSEVRNAPLSPDERALASTLLEHGNWLCVNTDPLDRAGKFSELSDLILMRMNRAAERNDEKAMQRLSRRYIQLMRGIGGNMARVNAAERTAPRNSRKLERIERRHAEQERKLQLMAARASKAMERDIRRSIEVSKRQERNLKGSGRAF